MQVSVDFHPMKTGDHSGSLTVHYDTGKRWVLHGACSAPFKPEPFLSRIFLNLFCKLLLKPFLSKPLHVSVLRSEQRGKGCVCPCAVCPALWCAGGPWCQLGVLHLAPSPLTVICHHSLLSQCDDFTWLSAKQPLAHSPTLPQGIVENIWRSEETHRLRLEKFNN